MKAMDGGELKYEYRLLEAEIKNLKELMGQHDKLTELAISKSEANYDERFQKNNEFREQLKDMIATLARQKETDSSINAVILRIEILSKTVNDKIDVQMNHFAEIISSVRKDFTEKREAAVKSVEDKLYLEIKSKEDKFANVDIQMKTLIDSNAEVSNKGLKDVGIQVIEINRWRDNTDGRMFIINRLIGILISIVIGVVIALVISIIKK